LLPQHRDSIRTQRSDSDQDDPPRPAPPHFPREFPLAWVSPPQRPLICDPDRVALLRSIAAPYTPGPSGDDWAANPSVSDIRPGSIRVGCLCGGAKFFPGIRTPDKPRNRGEQIAALKR